MNILIAEDGVVPRRVLSDYLKGLGHQVEEARDGVKAWEKFQKGDFPFVITDWDMPEMDGLELIRRIRGAERDGYVYVILLTAKAETADTVKGLETGADDFITKPFDEDELRVRIRAGERILELEKELDERNENLVQTNQKLTVINSELDATNKKLYAANQRMKRDLDAAAEIQQAFLPTVLPDIPRIQFAWVFKPCEELAGDMLNIIKLDETHVGLYVADVSGHGVPAALFSVSLSQMLSRTVGPASILREATDSPPGYRIVPPSEVALRLNRRFAEAAETEQYFTLVYGVLDVETNEFRYSCAGHPGPIQVSSEGRPNILDGSGYPIGMIDTVKGFDEQCIEMKSGDRLYLYSDGVPEAMNPADEQFGYNRFLNTVDKARAKDLKQSVSFLVNCVDDWCSDSPAEDDVSLLAFEMV